MSSGLYQIEKLDDENYDGWAVQMRSVLVHCELWQYVSGAIVKPTGNADATAAWSAKDEKALATILLSVKSSQILHIKKCQTSSDAWKKLKEVHRPSGPAIKVTLFKQLLNLKMAESMSMSNHLNNFFDILEKLTEIDIKLQDELLAILILSSLPKSYENFVIAIESRDDLPKVSALKTKLLEEGRRREGDVEHDPLTSSEAAFFSKQRKKQQRKSFTGKCFKCGKKGHMASECRTKDAAAKVSGNNKLTSSFAMLNGTNVSSLNKHMWVLDSGSTCHMCCNESFFTSLREHRENIELAADNVIQSDGIGEVLITTDQCKIQLRDVLFVKNLKTNFISLSKATENNNRVILDKNSGLIENFNGTLLMRAKRVGNLFVFQVEREKLLNLNTKNLSFSQWHERFGHLNAKSLTFLLKNNMVEGVDINNLVTDTLKCETCLKGKMTTIPFPKCSAHRSSKVLELIHSDICGPFRINSIGGARYFVLFIDDFSRKMFVYFLKQKSEVFQAFKRFKSAVELETSQKIKSIRTDNGCEYLSREFSNFLEEAGIQRQLTVQYTPQQNGVAERANRTVVEMARCMILHAGVPEYLWAEAVNTAVYIRNRCPTKVLKDITPYEAWSGKKPIVSHFRTFGCKAFMLEKRSGRSKFKAKSTECIMVGYSSESKAYRVYEPKSRQIYKSRDLKFLEEGNSNKSLVDVSFLDERTSQQKNKDPETLTVKIDAFNSSESNDEDLSEDEEFTDAENAAVEVVDDVTNVKDKSEDNCADYEIDGEADDGNLGAENGEWANRLRPRTENRFFFNYNQVLSNPNTVQEALSREDSDRWLSSMKSEYDTLISNGTWELVALPSNRRPIKSKWVFNIKRDKHGNVERYKSRLVAKGCSQKFGVDYTETFSPVVRYSSIRLILALAAEFDLHVHQLDVTSAYLNGVLQEEVYMQQPEGFVDKNNPNLVCKLKKTIYGLKQSGREWNFEIDEALKKIGFSRCNGDRCVYTMNEGKSVNIVAVYVDDILLACSSFANLEKIKHQIGLHFDIVDKGAAEHFLGMEISRKGSSVQVSSKQFIKNFLRDLGMEDCRPCGTPLDPGSKFKKCLDCTNCKKVDPKTFQSIIGSLMYLSVTTRPDIMHSVCKLAQFNVNPHIEHLNAAKHIIRYLKMTLNLTLTYFQSGERLRAFADADWAGSCDDRKSFTGYVFVLGGAAINWESRKQKSVALSSTEAEYVALSSAAKELIHLKTLLIDLGFSTLVNGPIELFGDNLSAQQIVKNPVHHSRTKHIDIKFHHIRDLSEKQVIVLKYIPTGDMVADILTKNLMKTKHCHFAKKLGLI